MLELYLKIIRTNLLMFLLTNQSIYLKLSKDVLNKIKRQSEKTTSFKIAA